MFAVVAVNVLHVHELIFKHANEESVGTPAYVTNAQVAVNGAKEVELVLDQGGIQIAVLIDGLLQQMIEDNPDMNLEVVYQIGHLLVCIGRLSIRPERWMCLANSYRVFMHIKDLQQLQNVPKQADSFLEFKVIEEFQGVVCMLNNYEYFRCHLVEHAQTLQNPDLATGFRGAIG